jgi:hypothetical protein
VTVLAERFGVGDISLSEVQMVCETRQGPGPQDFQDALAVQRLDGREGLRSGEDAAKGSWNP